MAQVILFFAEAAYPEVDHRVDELFAGFGVKIEVIHRRWEKGEEMSRVRWGSPRKASDNAPWWLLLWRLCRGCVDDSEDCAQ